MSLSLIDIAVILLIALVVIVSFRLSARRPVARHDKAALGTGQPGRSLHWVLDSKRSTEIISNERLAAIQRHKSKGGTLEDNDLVIVWAQEFLDDSVLFDMVKDNLYRTIRYLYVLDRVHVKRFNVFLSRLRDEPDFEVKKDNLRRSINAIFVKSELTMNNFVLMAPKSRRQVCYSAMIYERLPFAWLKQDGYRAHLMLMMVENLLRSVLLGAFLKDPKAAHATEETKEAIRKTNSMFQIKEQSIEGLNEFIQRLVPLNQSTLTDFPVDVDALVKETTIPLDGGSTLVNLEKDVQPQVEHLIKFRAGNGSPNQADGFPRT